MSWSFGTSKENGPLAHLIRILVFDDQHDQVRVVVYTRFWNGTREPGIQRRRLRVTHAELAHVWLGSKLTIWLMMLASAQAWSG
jgi:hypothetical protein